MIWSTTPDIHVRNRKELSRPLFCSNLMNMSMATGRVVSRRQMSVDFLIPGKFRQIMN
jgi:hypothetical protein